MENNIKMDILESSNNTWVINNQGPFRKAVFQSLLDDDISENGVSNIFENANSILLRCPNPSVVKQSSITGIVIGKVQSGKTSNFIATIALAFDNGYSISVVLGGNKKNLASQNAFRIQQYFAGCKDSVVVLSTESNQDLLNSNNIKDFLENKKKVIIVGLKHQKHIRLIKSLFEGSELASCPVMIIDDEGDQASLNTKIYINNEASPIYASINELRSSINIQCFLSVTATPQANILMPTISLLTPDFGILVYPGNDYCGLNEFHGEKSNIFVKEIDQKENNLIDGPAVPPSFFKAFAAFFVGAAIRMNRGDYGAHSMLIHPSYKKYDHLIVKNKISAIREKWINSANLELNGIHDFGYQPIRTCLVEAYNMYKKDGVMVPSFDELEKDILMVIKQVGPVLLCNSDSDASKNAKFYKYNIFLGGNMVERGLTFKGLAVTYITRRAKGISNVDNTEQRARWFGYKRSYLDVCRVFTTKDIKDDFSHILECDDDLWQTIERAQANGIPFKSMPRIFSGLSDVLRFTRPNVAKTDNFSFPQWEKENFFLNDKTASVKNEKLILDFFDLHKKEMSPYPIFGSSNTDYPFLKKVDLNFVYESLIKKMVFRKGSNFDSHVFYVLIEALRKIDDLRPVDIVFMRYPNFDSRSIYDDYSIDQVFQGKRANYPGDGGLPNSYPENIQLQIHVIKAIDKPSLDYRSVSLALYIPISICNKMASLGGRVDDGI